MKHQQTGEKMLVFRFRSALVCVLLALAVAAWLPSAAAAQSSGTPILVVANDSFGGYYAEILRAEGLNEFAVGDAGHLNPQALSNYQVVVLGAGALSDAHVSALNDWVQGGGNLIAMQPDARLAPLLGLGSDIGDLGERGYIRVEPGSNPGAGITTETMQFHGVADRWTLAGATSVATLYSSPSAATTSPAVTLRSVGPAGGQAAAFTYDLARSVVGTRQGNLDWEGDERDFALDTLTRSDDMFFGAKPGDVQPDWVNLEKVHIPQADEQQRLLANLITQMNVDRAPLPRFWYLPRGEKAAVVMTGDDHKNGGTAGQFDRFIDDSPAGCSVADWECIRATSYVYPDTPIPGAESFEDAGFEIALHLSTNCQDFDSGSLSAAWDGQLPDFGSSYPSIAAPVTNRTHCIAWSDWASEATVGRVNGIRLDTNYYYWPGNWMLDKPGMFTGSGFPMRFADRNGALIDVYQATTQLTDEWGDGPQYGVVDAHIRTLLNRALGPEGYYGAFTANMHTDGASHAGADKIVAAATASGVPIISARQLLDWLDGRNGSSFQGISFSGGRLSFTVAGGTRGLEAMVPASGPNGGLLSLTRNGAPAGVTARHVKGIDYGVFDAAPGSYVATYAGGGGAIPPGTGGGFKPLPVPPIGGGSSKGGTLGAGGQSAPRVKVMKRTARASRNGYVRLRLRCPSSADSCFTSVRIKRKGRLLARKSFELDGGKTTKVKLRLKRRARAQLAEAGSLRANAVLRVTQGERSPTVTKTRIELLAH